MSSKLDVPVSGRQMTAYCVLTHEKEVFNGLARDESPENIVLVEGRRLGVSSNSRENLIESQQTQMIAVAGGVWHSFRAGARVFEVEKTRNRAADDAYLECAFVSERDVHARFIELCSQGVVPEQCFY